LFFFFLLFFVFGLVCIYSVVIVLVVGSIKRSSLSERNNNYTIVAKRQSKATINIRAREKSAWRKMRIWGEREN